ncbi:putative PAP2 superfamily [Trypanosoma vivax]|uniref:Putative phosphatidic acid phosphatase n=1 Tax=Trypanosoma vivax (strain Y486) TaxID=1055687 RepID=G0U4E1_TRYVY|nr:putative phosphatidic acid phosphatase [Trypanosoma vivax]KAH8611376.1 putative PAP2 superfamily [Trypanosoma vivax]CCC52305.1 putative phosphatidic acid phosphatase, fragment [Trypanosoma vivax Y486]
MSSTQSGPRFQFVWLYRLPEHFLCIVVGLLSWLIEKKAPVFCRSFSWEDPAISAEHKDKSTFPTWSLIPMAILAAALVIIVEWFRARSAKAGAWYLDRDASAGSQEEISSEMAVVCREGGENQRDHQSGGTTSAEQSAVTNNGPGASWGSRRSLFWQTVSVWVLTFLLSIMFSTFIVACIKVYVGRLRPDFIQRLKRDGYTKQSNAPDLCGAAREGRLSFPSGHSSAAFSAMTPLTVYLLGLFRAFGGLCIWRVAVSLLPMCLAIVIAASRTRDNRHHFSDVIGGSLIGAVFALLSVGLFFRFSRKAFLVPRRLELARRRDGALVNENPV